jgi:hypothetical protein
LNFVEAAYFQKGQKIFISKPKKFGGNITTLIFALPKRNKGIERERKKARSLGHRKLGS